MPDDTQDAKAQKLAAARKKLKEYQQRNNNNIDENVGTNTNSSTVSIASNLSERSDCELTSSNGGGTQQGVDLPAPALFEEASYFPPQAVPQVETILHQQSIWPHNGQGDTNLQTIQVLIAEKAQLNTELTKCRHLSRERELEMEELRTEHGQTLQRLEQLQQHCQDQQRNAEQQRSQNAELQTKLTVGNAQVEDHQAHLSELEAQILQLNLRLDELNHLHADKCNELDMAQLRIRQLSDESNVNADNRVETLTQTQYMYEQQIRDLQQMVAQLTQDKEQAAVQYQNYVAKLNERNTELGEESVQLKERERQLVEHVSGLERDIQKNLALQAQYKVDASMQQQSTQDESVADLTVKIAKLQEQVSDLEFERHEFQLKIKSQDDQLQLKEEKLADLDQELQRLQAHQPDQVKLLATMESDKVAASRALSQNMDMKQQLDELQLRFVQLTNDKLELVNKLDAEEFANREMHANYSNMQKKLQANEDRFKFKDDEMIRLSHENVELQRSHLMLQQQVDRLQHYEAKAYHSHDLKETLSAESAAVECASDAHEHENDHLHTHIGEHQDKLDEDHHNQHNHKKHSHAHQAPSCETPLLPTAEAVEKLQLRFTTLISKVADLTEEKQSLEHLVLQLQSETETIGEYITLYQTQRRMLKQREYEKATQMQLLKAEREQLREKIDVLNKLVGSLGLAVELPAEQLQLTADVNVETQQQQLPTNDNVIENGNSQQILHKIQDIITEIKVNTEHLPASLSSGTQPGHTVDHLNCCLGKFEVV